MIKRYIIFMILFIFFVISITALDVDYTKRFFAAKISDNRYCFVFIHENKIDFVYKEDRRNPTKIEIEYNDKFEDAFIVNNFFIIKIINTHFFYDLNKIINQNSNNRSLDYFRAREYELPNSEIENIYIHDNELYYTKRNNSGLYQYIFSAPRGNRDQIIFDTRSVLTKQFIYIPLVKSWNDEFNRRKIEVTEIINNYKNLEANISNEDIQRKLIEFKGNQTINPQITNVNNEISNYIKNRYPVDRDVIRDFFTLSELLGVEKKTEANNLIGQMGAPNTKVSIAQNRLNEFYNNNTQLIALKDPNEHARRLQQINDDIETKKRDISRIWGREYSVTLTNINRAAIEQWRDNNFSAIASNNSRLVQLQYAPITGSRMESLLTNPALRNNSEYKINEYEILRDYYLEISKGNPSERNLSQSVIDIINKTGSFVNGRQINLRGLMERNLRNAKVEIDNFEIRKSETTAKYNADVREKETQINNILTDLRRGFINNFKYDENVLITGLRNQGNNFSPNKDTNNIFILNEDSRYINGFDRFPAGMNISINLNRSEFPLSGIPLQRSSTYSLISSTGKGIFFTINKNTIAYYNLSRPRTIINDENLHRIETSSNDVISYFVKNSYDENEKYQYFITNQIIRGERSEDGQLRRINIDEKPMRISESLGSVKVSDNVFVSGRSYYIFTDNGIITENGRVTGNRNDIKIKACNSNNSYLIGFERNKFVIN